MEIGIDIAMRACINKYKLLVVTTNSQNTLEICQLKPIPITSTVQMADGGRMFVFTIVILVVPIANGF